MPLIAVVAITMDELVLRSIRVYRDIEKTRSSILEIRIAPSNHVLKYIGVSYILESRLLF